MAPVTPQSGRALFGLSFVRRLLKSTQLGRLCAVAAKQRLHFVGQAVDQRFTRLSMWSFELLEYRCAS